MPERSQVLYTVLLRDRVFSAVQLLDTTPALAVFLGVVQHTVRFCVKVLITAWSFAANTNANTASNLQGLIFPLDLFQLLQQAMAQIRGLGL